MRIRIANTDDVPDIFNVRTSVKESLLTIEGMASIGITHASLISMIESESARAWCVELDGKIVGFSMATLGDREVFALFVLPEYENRGYGSALLEKAVNWLTQAGNDSIWLIVEPGVRAFSFYKKRGWRETGLSPEEDVLKDDVYLEYRP